MVPRMRAKQAAGTHGKITTTPHYRADDGALRVIPETAPCGECGACLANDADDSLTLPCGHPINLWRGPHRVNVDSWRGRTQVRMPDGSYRSVECWRPTKAAATAAVEVAVRDLLARSGARALARSNKTVGDVATDWAKSIQEDARLAARTRELYAGTVNRHVLGSALAAMLPRDVKAGDVEDHLNAVARANGAGTAKTCRTVLSKVLGRAVRRGLAERNVVRDAEPTVIPINAKRTAHMRVVGDDGQIERVAVERDHDRALTTSEAAGLLWFAYRDPSARQPDWAHRAKGDPTGRDTADLMAFMLSTGVRIGEALAARWGDFDPVNGSMNITGTITRVTGGGLVRGGTKTADSNRAVPLPLRTLAMLRRRQRATGGKGATPIFATTRGTFRDVSNTNRYIRSVLDRSGLSWVTSHTFRRSVLTRLGDAGIPLRQIADLAGHANPAMTARRYLGRRGPNEALRAAL